MPVSFDFLSSFFHTKVDPKVLKAQGKVENVKKASIAVSNLETQIGLAPGTVNNLIDNVEKNAKDEVLRYEDDMARQKSEIQSEKKLIQVSINYLSTENEVCTGIIKLRPCCNH